MNFTADEIKALLPYCTAAERAEIDAILAADTVVWRPLPGPQTMAYYSVADVVGFGGAAGGGKTDLAIGKALTQHENVAMFRREGTEMAGIIDRMKGMLGHDTGYVGSGRWWGWREPVPGVQIEFGSIPNLGDETKHQGRPKDLLVLDEAANMLEQQARFLMGWVRTTNPNQRTQTLMCFNPPTTAEGRWIVEFFGPWLNKKHPNPALPGELRWFAMIAGKEMEVPCGQRFVYQGELIIPQSRTFIPARIADNPYLMGTNYMATLQAMPEPLRSQMLYGDFDAGMEDDPWQVIPTAWVDAAMARWTAMLPKPRMDSMGVDVARGGKDNTILSRRHSMWFDELLAYTGKETPDGPTVAGLVVANIRDRAPIHIDVIGVGASPYDFLIKANQPVYGINVAEAANGTDKSGRLTFYNLRSQLWWRMREALDPANNTGIALPQDRRLMLDLCAPKWELRGKAIFVQSREEILKDIGRSPDYASAVILALIDTPRLLDVPGRGALDTPQREYDPLANLNR